MTATMHLPHVVQWVVGTRSLTLYVGEDEVGIVHEVGDRFHVRMKRRNQFLGAYRRERDAREALLQGASQR